MVSSLTWQNQHITDGTDHIIILTWCVLVHRTWPFWIHCEENPSTYHSKLLAALTLFEVINLPCNRLAHKRFMNFSC